MPTKKPAKKLTTEQKLKAQVKQLTAELNKLSADRDCYATWWRDRRDEAADLQKQLDDRTRKYEMQDRQEVQHLQQEVHRLTELLRWQINPETAAQDLELQEKSAQGRTGGYYPGPAIGMGY